jgi:hypothetical protein
VIKSAKIIVRGKDGNVLDEYNAMLTRRAKENIASALRRAATFALTSMQAEFPDAWDKVEIQISRENPK